MSAASLDIVIVSFNAREDLRRCLTSLRDAPPARPHTIIVVDNASTDGSPGAVTAAMPSATLIELKENLGFARGTNAGIRAGRGALVLLLNGDTVVPAGALDRLCLALERTPEAAAAGPRLVDGDGRAELSHGRMMSPWNELRQKMLVGLHARRVGPVSRLVERLTRQPAFVDWVSGACLLVWRAEAEAAGLLDERFFMYGEDVDFCATLRRRGRRIRFSPEAEIVHLRGRSAAAAPEATRLAYRRSQLAFYRKHHPRWRRLLEAYLWAKGQRPARSP